MFELLICVTLLTGQTEPWTSATTRTTTPGPTLVQRLVAPEIDRLSGLYRIRNYDRYRSNRAKYDHRWELADDLVRSWYVSGQRPNHRDLVIRWFQAAQVASQNRQADALPPLPSFAKRSSSDKTPGDANKNDGPAHRNLDGTLSPTVPSLERQAPNKLDPSNLFDETPASPLFDSSPSGTTGQTRSPYRGGQATSPLFGSLGRAVLNAAAGGTSGNTDSLSSIEPFGFSPVIQHAAPTDEARSQLDLGELTSRVAGYNFGLRAVEAELSDGVEWNARRLASLVQRLDDLVERRKTLDTYLDFLSGDDRRSVGRLESFGQITEDIQRQIQKTRSEIKGDDFGGTPADRQRKLELLDSVLRLLSELAGKP